MKINILDKNGFYVEDHVEGELPTYWTKDLVGNGYYKAQYQEANIDVDTGEWTGGTWVETSGPSLDDLNRAKQQFNDDSIIKKNQMINDASTRISILNDRIEIGEERQDELLEWKLYRIALDDIDISIIPIVWPVIPSR
ncbi:tail assembly chaperone gp38 [Yersinia pekkanenii]|uniref:Tail assembly chaperone gp38 n=1 Tax=Yersinia pekkanenii TaxID=1288385 RepID=A0A0T9PTD4_9GAMM|nr:tail fiber assembly protein [Yersinia pekkanenii]CNH80919.1 tail assembly chaperone gp38 [Yersinia pekkanenii]